MSGLAATRTISPSRRKRSSWQRYLPGDVGRYVAALVCFVWALFPIVFIISSALNPAGTLSTAQLLPRQMSLSNFRDLFNDPVRPYADWFRNSLVICLTDSLITVFIGACSAYAFSRLRFKGRRAGLMGLLLIQLFPGTLAFLALYITFDQIGNVIPVLGLNTTLGLVLAYTGGAMSANVWLLKGYLDTVPRELDEAARVDGASHARIFFTIITPLVMPILVTVFMVSFIGFFSEFLLAGLFLQDVHRQTLAVGLNGMLKADRNKYFGQFCAGALLASIPVVALYFGFQKQLTGGLTQGSVK